MTTPFVLRGEDRRSQELFTGTFPFKVDSNVTRHLDGVLGRGGWDVLILHYLGLDHIGHVSGPSSPLIGHKLSEMDSILMKIHTSLLSEVSCCGMWCWRS